MAQVIDKRVKVDGGDVAESCKGTFGSCQA